MCLTWLDMDFSPQYHIFKAALLISIQKDLRKPFRWVWVMKQEVQQQEHPADAQTRFWEDNCEEQECPSKETSMLYVICIVF